MATDTGHSNTLDYTQDIINIVDAIDRVRDELATQNALIQLIVDELETMDDTQAEYLSRASTSSKGIYTNGVIGQLSRALLMTSISKERLQELVDEINDPTPLPGDNG